MTKGEVTMLTNAASASWVQRETIGAVTLEGAFRVHTQPSSFAD